MTASEIKKQINKLKNPQQARILQGFFKTGKGEYGEGDKFLGIKTAPLREIAKEHKDLPLNEVQKLLDSLIHEERFVGVIILTYKFVKANEEERKNIYDFYLKNTTQINNWDLVDLSAPNIVGQYLLSEDRKILYKLAGSKNLWERRIAIISTFAFIRNNQFEDTLKISEILLGDKHDLIHKAVGWMLREVGKRSLVEEEKFLKKHCQRMPRTMLRYAIERMEEGKRKSYMVK